MQSLKQQVQSA